MVPSSEPRRDKVLLLITTRVEAIHRRLAAERTSPRQDFDALAERLGGRILSFDDLDAAPLAVRLVRRLLGDGPALALLGFRSGADAFFTAAESCGLPLAFLLKFRRRPARHVMIAHKLSGKAKPLLIRGLQLLRGVSGIIVYSPLQAADIPARFGYPAGRVHRIEFQVDERFHAQTPAPAAPGLLAVGREFRDYPTLFAAVERLGVPLTVVASSPWSNKADETRGRALPAGVTLKRGLSSENLRAEYRKASAVVVPLKAVDSPAGITSILEAQATGRPVVMSDTPGLRGCFTDGRDALLVPCGDAAAMEAALRRLLADPDLGTRLAAGAFAGVVERRTLDRFTANIGAVMAAAPEV